MEVTWWHMGVDIVCDCGSTINPYGLKKGLVFWYNDNGIIGCPVVLDKEACTLCVKKICGNIDCPPISTHFTVPVVSFPIPPEAQYLSQKDHMLYKQGTLNRLKYELSKQQFISQLV